MAMGRWGGGIMRQLNDTAMQWNGDGIKQHAHKADKPEIWWSNMFFFIAMHVLAAVGVFRLSPWYDLDRRTLMYACAPA